MSALAWSPISETTGAGHSPFADAAPKLFTRLAVMPVGGSDGKKPLLKGWNKWTRRPGKDFIEKLMERCPGANIGTVCGPSGLFIVDNDDPRAVQAMLERFGDTPLKTSTPSGGVHLWYRNSGEGCANLRREGLKVDLKGNWRLCRYSTVNPPHRPVRGQHLRFSGGLVGGPWTPAYDPRWSAPFRQQERISCCPVAGSEGGLSQRPLVTVANEACPAL
jgi:hypothetical protein